MSKPKPAKPRQIRVSMVPDAIRALKAASALKGMTLGEYIAAINERVDPATVPAKE